MVDQTPRSKSWPFNPRAIKPRHRPFAHYRRKYVDPVLTAGFIVGCALAVYWMGHAGG